MTDPVTVDAVATTVDTVATTVDASDVGTTTNEPPHLATTDDVMNAVKGVIRWTRNKMSLPTFVENTARMSYEVQKELAKTIGSATDGDKLPVSTDDFLAWSRAKRGRDDARGLLLTSNALMNMLYLAYCTAVAMEELGDWIREKCQVLEDQANRARDSESDAAQERADSYDELRDEHESYADDAEGCSAPAFELKRAIEADDLDAAIAAIEDGDFFLDIGKV